ncbi:MAG: penicillin acylase family protein [Planctomycetes bacterium]|nr:penicillin acylase family protein [Planctomycetota bacterium]
MSTPTGLTNLLGRVLRRWLTGRSRARLPLISGTLALPGLSSPVEIFRDRWGIPHVYAASARDLLFAQGFVHAQDRFWQMELNRRTAAGRLSELFGPVALETDRLARTMGFRRTAGEDWKLLPDPARDAVQAYADGVNAWISDPSSRPPVELFLLRQRPEPWTAADTLAFSRLMMWMLSHAWSAEVVRAELVQKAGEELAAELEIRYPDRNPIVLPQGIDFSAFGPDGSLAAVRGPFVGRGRGSNSWAVAGRLTATGKPFLCNDVHLQLSIPSIWYEAHLEGGGFRVTGGSIAGLPFVLAGHNARIAWGVTLAFTDAEDLFLEEFDPADRRRVKYRGSWEDVRVVPEEIRIKGRGPHVEDVAETRHGPVVSGLVGKDLPRALALSSMSLRPSSGLEGWRRLNLAAGWDDFVGAARWIEAPQLAMPYADVDGNIGYWVTGKLPVRAKGQGLAPVPGWDGEHEWTGEVPFEEMPHALNPRAGRVVTANHRIVPDGYPHFLGAAWMNGWRARRIEEALSEKKNGFTAADFRALQADLVCLPGRELVARLAGTAGASAAETAALDLLRAWDGVLGPDSRGGAVYEVLRGFLARELLEPVLGRELAARALGAGTHPLILHSNEYFGHDTTLVLRMLDAPASAWVVRAGGRDAWIARSLAQAVDWLRGRLGPDPAAWSWGRLHRAHFHHALALRKPFDVVFGIEPVPVGGDGDTVLQSMWSPGDPWEAHSYCPTIRTIMDLSDWSKSIAMHAPGQSGQLGSPHYDDLVKLWAKGEYHPMLWERAEIVRVCPERLVLDPA